MENIFDEAIKQKEHLMANHPFESGFTVAGVDMSDNSLYFVGHYETLEAAHAASKKIAPEKAWIYGPGWKAI